MWLRTASDLAAGKQRWPACMRGDDGGVMAANILPWFEMRWKKRESKNTYLNILCRVAVARSLGACKVGVVGGELCWQLQQGDLCMHEGRCRLHSGGQAQGRHHCSSQGPLQSTHCLRKNHPLGAFDPAKQE